MSEVKERPQKMVNGIKLYIQIAKNAARLLAAPSTSKNRGGTDNKKAASETERPIASCSPKGEKSAAARNGTAGNSMPT